MTFFVLQLCIVLVLSTAIPRISGQTPSPPAPTPPSGAGAGGSSATPPSGSSASGSSASPPPGSSASPPPGSSATPPARASVPPSRPRAAYECIFNEVSLLGLQLLINMLAKCRCSRQGCCSLQQSSALPNENYLYNCCIIAAWTVQGATT